MRNFHLSGEILFPTVPQGAPPEIEDEARRCRELYYNYVDTYAAYKDCVEALTGMIDSWKKTQRRLPVGPGSGASPYGRMTSPQLTPATARRVTIPFAWGFGTYT